jgi:hypothetical protein
VRKLLVTCPQQTPLGTAAAMVRMQLLIAPLI